MFYLSALNILGCPEKALTCSEKMFSWRSTKEINTTIFKHFTIPRPHVAAVMQSVTQVVPESVCSSPGCSAIGREQRSCKQQFCRPNLRFPPLPSSLCFILCIWLYDMTQKYFTTRYKSFKSTPDFSVCNNAAGDWMPVHVSWFGSLRNQACWSKEAPLVCRP